MYVQKKLLTADKLSDVEEETHYSIIVSPGIASGITQRDFNM